MSRSNSLWGAPRIHGELLKLGLKASEATVAKYRVPRRLRGGPDWRVFLRNELVSLQESRLSVELKAAWDELKGLGACNGSEPGTAGRPESASPIMVTIGPGLVMAMASLDSRKIAGSDLEKPVSILPAGECGRGPPVWELHSQNLGRQIELPELVCEGEFYDARCAA
jgi:hypothetical protein